MFEKLFGLITMNSTDTPKNRRSVRSGKNRVAQRQQPEGNAIPIAVNWDPSQDENKAVQSFMESSALVRLSEHWRSKSAVKITSAGMETAKAKAPQEAEAELDSDDETSTRKSVDALLDKLSDGLQWMVVENKNCEWYMPSVNTDNEPILEKAMDGWMLHIAEDANTPAHMLEDLALNEDHNVRMAVADNPNTPIDLLMVLARDEHLDIRYALAENHNIDTAVHNLLLDDDNPYVADRARRTLKRLNCVPVVSYQFSRPVKAANQSAIK
jgi:hypothetical protein